MPKMKKLKLNCENQTVIFFTKSFWTMKKVESKCKEVIRTEMFGVAAPCWVEYEFEDDQDNLTRGTVLIES